MTGVAGFNLRPGLAGFNLRLKTQTEVCYSNLNSNILLPGAIRCTEQAKQGSYDLITLITSTGFSGSATGVPMRVFSIGPG